MWNNVGSITKEKCPRTWEAFFVLRSWTFLKFRLSDLSPRATAGTLKPAAPKYNSSPIKLHRKAPHHHQNCRIPALLSGSWVLSDFFSFFCSVWGSFPRTSGTWKFSIFYLWVFQGISNCHPWIIRWSSAGSSPKHTQIETFPSLLGGSAENSSCVASGWWIFPETLHEAVCRVNTPSLAGGTHKNALRKFLLLPQYHAGNISCCSQQILLLFL